jgi:subtilisin family serine protease
MNCFIKGRKKVPFLYSGGGGIYNYTDSLHTVSSVNINIKEIQLINETGEIIIAAANTGVFDLMSLQSDATSLFSTTEPIAKGNYSEIRFLLEDWGNTVNVDGVLKSLVVPCNDMGAQPGGLRFVGNFNVVSGFFTRLTFDFSQPFILENSGWVETEVEDHNSCYVFENENDDDDYHEKRNHLRNHGQRFSLFNSFDHDNEIGERNDDDEEEDDDDDFKLKQSIPLIEAVAVPPFVPGLLLVTLNESVTITADSYDLPRLTGIASIDALSDKYLCFQIIPITDYMKDEPGYDAQQAQQAGFDKLYIFFFYPETDVILAMLEYESDPNIESAFMDTLIEGPKAPVEAMPWDPNNPPPVRQWPINSNQYVPDDPYADISYPVTANQGDALGAIKAYEGWMYSTGDSSVKVAVIDTGIDDTHPDLSGRVNQGKAYYTGACYFDSCDTTGCDCVFPPYPCPKTKSTSLPLEYLPAEPYTNIDHMHGTHVAGILGGTGDNGQGLAGINWQSEIISHRVMQWDRSLDSDSMTQCSDVTRACASTSNIILAIEKSIVEGSKVINLSLGSPRNDYCVEDNDGVQCGKTYSWYNAAFRHTEANDIVVVASAGNDGQYFCDTPNLDSCSNGTSTPVYLPASFENVISVASMNKNSNYIYNLYTAESSNYGKINVAAPGVQILSTIPIDLRIDFGLPTTDYDFLNGTSMAAPFVAGLASLVFSINPNLSAEEVRNLIYDNAYDVPSGGGNSLSGCVTTDGIDDCTGYGLIDIEATLKNTPASGGSGGGNIGTCTAAFISFWPALYHQFGFLFLYLLISMIRIRRKQV